MNLDEVKLTRRKFLASIGAVVAGAVVPGFALTVDAPAYEAPVLRHMESGIQRHAFTTNWQVNPDGVLSAAMKLPGDAVGDAELWMLWSAEGEREFGWWADYLEIHQGAKREDESLHNIIALPETTGVFMATDEAHVTHSSLGRFGAKPEGLLVVGIYAPEASPIYRRFHWEASGAMIHGLRLDYETA